MSELTPQQRVKLARHFIMHSPPGELSNVVTDVRTLVQDDDLLNQNVLDALREYNHKQLLLARLPGSASGVLVISPHNELDASHYVDPRNKTVVTFDHVKQEVTEVRAAADGEIASSLDAQRASLQSAVDAYVQNHYPSGSGLVCEAADGSSLVVCISSSKSKLDAFWTGSWRAVHTVKVSGDSATIDTVVQATVHYFENGNVQLNTRFAKSSTVAVKSADEFGKTVAKRIENVELDYHTALNQHTYKDLPDQQFKNLRRQLPLVKQGMNWELRSQYTLGADMMGAGQ